jgi:hypothetical protein
MLLHCLQRPDDDILHLEETLISFFNAILAHHIMFKLVDQPFPTPDLIIILGMLLNLDICQMTF